MMTLLLFAEDNQIGYDDYKSRLRTTRMALVANSLSVDKQGVVVTTRVS